jgi:mono/diheme cytochrome c family protein
VISPLICLGGLLAAARLPQGLQKTLAAVFLIIGLVYMGSFEYIRETGRRPFVIYGHMYSNGLLKAQLPEVERQGILKYARWSRVKNITADNRTEAGQELFRLLCLSCHSVGGPRNDILGQVKGKGVRDLERVLSDMGTVQAQMPPFPGTTVERATLAWYLGMSLGSKNK